MCAMPGQAVSRANRGKKARRPKRGNDTLCAEAQPAWPGSHPRARLFGAGSSAPKQILPLLFSQCKWKGRWCPKSPVGPPPLPPCGTGPTSHIRTLPKGRCVPFELRWLAVCFSRSRGLAILCQRLFGRCVQEPGTQIMNPRIPRCGGDHEGTLHPILPA